MHPATKSRHLHGCPGSPVLDAFDAGRALSVCVYAERVIACGLGVVPGARRGRVPGSASVFAIGDLGWMSADRRP